jgi:hypothetical protein
VTGLGWELTGRLNANEFSRLDWSSPGQYIPVNCIIYIAEVPLYIIQEQTEAPTISEAQSTAHGSCGTDERSKDDPDTQSRLMVSSSSLLYRKSKRCRFRLYFMVTWFSVACYQKEADFSGAISFHH